LGAEERFEAGTNDTRATARGRPSNIYNVVTVFRDGVGYDSLKLRDAAKGKVGVN